MRYGKEKVAVCVISSNDSYVYKSVVDLLSVKKHNGSGNFEYFICGNFSNGRKKIIKKYGLKMIELKHLRSIFKSPKDNPIPKEMFYYCSVPKICYELSFNYSIILDGDVLCLKKVDVDEIKSIEEVGFVRRNLKMKDDPWMSNEIVKNEFKLNEEKLEGTYTIYAELGIYNNK